VGGVKKPGVYPLGPDAIDLLDIVAVSGGSSYPTYETRISLTRGDVRGQIYMNRVLSHHSENIFLKPHDEISIERMPQKFMALGAVQRAGHYDFGQPELTVLGAISKVQGLDDALADPTGVFLFRFEHVDTLRQLGYNIGGGGETGLRPVIYRFDLRDAAQYFHAKSIALRHDDVLYVSNASAVSTEKFLRILGRFVGMGTSAAVLSGAVN
jgi:polysaccharide export outer membrane protein